MSQQVEFNTDTNSGPSLVEEAAAMDAAAAAAAAAAANPPAEGTPPAAASTPNTDGRPDWLPSNFKTVEDFTKSYNDGRAELTRLQQELAAFKKGETPPATPPTDGKPADGAPAPKEGEETPPKTAEELAAANAEQQQQAAADAVANAGIDTTPFTEEFATTGDVTDEGRAKIAEALKGQFGEQARAMVDAFIEGQKATANNFRTSALNEAGGEENYAAMSQWAKANMKPGELKVYNDAVSSNDINAALLAIRGLKASYEEANGRPPSLATGNNTVANSSAVEPFASSKQMTDAINDPRYARDDAYRAQVIARITASSF